MNKYTYWIKIILFLIAEASEASRGAIFFAIFMKIKEKIITKITPKCRLIEIFFPLID